MPIRRVLPLFLLPLFAACGAESIGPTGFYVGVDAPYDGGSGVDFRVWNQGDRVAYVDACDFQVIGVMQRRVNGAWQDVGTTVCPTTASYTPLALAPAASVRSGTRGIDAAGEYRVTIVVRDTPNAADSVIVESQTITVRPGDLNRQ